MAAPVDIDKPVRVTIEITGGDLDTCGYALLDIAARLQVGKLSGAVAPGTGEGYRFTVTPL